VLVDIWNYLGTSLEPSGGNPGPVAVYLDALCGPLGDNMSTRLDKVRKIIGHRRTLVENPMKPLVPSRD
jgi:hypothetical protein